MSQIKFNQDGTINFGDYTLTFTDEGFEFDGNILATEYEENWLFGGTVSGYASGGEISGIASNIIDKFSFASDGNATDVGDLTLPYINGSGVSSSRAGYVVGGRTNAPAYNIGTIMKFSFASDGNATDVGTADTGWQGAGQSSGTNGYTSGATAPNIAGQATVAEIHKFPFATDGNTTDVGDLTNTVKLATGQSSLVSGYVSGGNTPASNVINKFSFAADGNATDVGDLTVGRFDGAGQSSTESGYASGGQSPGTTNVIDKFPFASDGNATDVGDLLQVGSYYEGQSSTASGYVSGGPVKNTIQKFPFASDANATDVGDLTVGRFRPAGQQG